MIQKCNCNIQAIDDIYEIEFEWTFNRAWRLLNRLFQMLDHNNKFNLTLSGSRRVSPLNDEVCNHPVELGPVVVVLHAELDKVPASLRTFSREEFDLDLAHGCLETDLPEGRRFVDVHLTHPDPLLIRVQLWQLRFDRNNNTVWLRLLWNKL